MCVGSSSPPASPTLPALPPPPPPVPRRTDPEVSRAGTRNRQRAALAEGRASTILTSGLGLTSPASTTAKTVLGA